MRQSSDKWEWLAWVAYAVFIVLLMLLSGCTTTHVDDRRCAMLDNVARMFGKRALR